MNTHLSSPFQFDRTGRTATAPDQDYIRSLIEAVLFTSPGERVNRPEFGCGLIELVFAGANSALETTVESTVRAALGRWLGEMIVVDRLDVSVVDTTVTVALNYVLVETNQADAATFSREL